ncbi:MAG TPA: hypothetical protein VM843_04500 [Flavisolibacter sp.]|nr:hypothetical protein [Flavisolibacter sp.]
MLKWILLHHSGLARLAKMLFVKSRVTTVGEGQEKRRSSQTGTGNEAGNMFSQGSNGPNSFSAY